MANYDFLPYDVEMFQNGNINITGFQIIDRETREYLLLKRYIEQFKQKDQSEDYLDLEVKKKLFKIKKYF